ncbi:hypothetical protein [Lacisediminimonas profundi]|uniref:hypothetical protein n=1 Tax=Lacisediminimonas profundi TaxID=2603856 RepID=UPI00124B871A|nr:hypothetical protein [Lacisediminimonas profundi]
MAQVRSKKYESASRTDTPQKKRAVASREDKAPPKAPALGAPARQNLKDRYHALLEQQRDEQGWKKWLKAHGDDDSWLQGHENFVREYAGRYSSIGKLGVQQMRESLKGVNDKGEKSNWTPDRIALFADAVIARRTIFDTAGSFEALRKLKSILAKGEGRSTGALLDKLGDYARADDNAANLRQAAFDIGGEDVLFSRLLHFASTLDAEEMNRADNIKELKKLLREMESRKGSTKGAGGSKRSSAPVFNTRDLSRLYASMEQGTGHVLGAAAALSLAVQDRSSMSSSTATTPRKPADAPSQADTASNSDAAISESDKGKGGTPPGNTPRRPLQRGSTRSRTQEVTTPAGGDSGLPQVKVARQWPTQDVLKAHIGKVTSDANGYFTGLSRQESAVLTRVSESLLDRNHAFAIPQFVPFASIDQQAERSLRSALEKMKSVGEWPDKELGDQVRSFLAEVLDELTRRREASARLADKRTGD